MIARLATGLLFAIATAVCGAQNPATGSTNSGASSPNSEALKEFERTRAQFLIDGKRAAAVAGLQHVLMLDPRFAPGWFDLGYMDELDKNWPEARRYFNKYLELAPSGPDATRAKDEISAIDRLSDPGYQKSADYASAIQRARIFLQAKLYRETIAETSRAQLIDGSRWEAYFIACIAMSRQGKTAEADKLRALTLDRVPPTQRAAVEYLLPTTGSSSQPAVP